MPKYQGPESHIHTIARGFLTQGDEVILCRPKGKDWFFLPGGHVEDSESSKNALVRELNEEMGEADYKVEAFAGVCESAFPTKGSLQHEINMVFHVEVPKDFEVKSTEDHIEFVSVKKEDFKNHKILPESLKEALLVWLEDRKTFLVSGML